MNVAVLSHVTSFPCVLDVRGLLAMEAVEVDANRKIVTNKMPTMANTAWAEARERLNRVTIGASTVRVH